MKIIDLLNKIANGEEVPKKIKYDDSIYTFNDKKDNYYENETCSINWDYVSLHCLNEEVEILEEEKKIPEKLSTWFSLEKDCENDNIHYANNNFKTMYEKINEICDYLKSKGE